MKRIIQDIKEGTFVHVYLLYGEEAYLRKQYRDKLKCALVSPDDTMNCSIYAGKDINANEVVDMAGTMPFFAERRVIVIENSGWMKTGNEKMVDFLKHIPETTYMIFVEEEVDKRSKLFKAVSSNGYAAVCDVQDENTLKKWIMGLLKKENKLITPDALNLLLDRTGTDMENIRHEVEKLICYKYEEEGITAKDVEELCTVRVQNKIFDMVEAVADKKQKQALDLYYDLLALKEAPLKILALIARQFNILLQVREMKAKGYENAYFGFSDESSEGNWKWVNGTSTSYTNWHSGEPSNQDGIEHYAMFYENFQDGTWNDADGIIDAGCAYICEWDDPTDKISQGDSFTDQQLRIIAKDLGVPDDLNVEIRQSPKAYWEAAGLWDIYVEITHNGKLVASGSFDVETGEMGRNIYIYTPV